MDQKDVPEKVAAKAVEELIDRTIVGKGAESATLFTELKRATKKTTNSEYVKYLIDNAERIISQEWFAKAMPFSQKLTEFKKAVQELK